MAGGLPFVAPSERIRERLHLAWRTHVHDSVLPDLAEHVVQAQDDLRAVPRDELDEAREICVESHDRVTRQEMVDVRRAPEEATAGLLADVQSALGDHVVDA